MDWRAASRSRSRVSVMDWRPQSRSRSRSTFNRVRNPYDHGSEAHSHSLLGREDVVEPNPMFYESQMYNDFQSWPLGGASLPNLPHTGFDITTGDFKQEQGGKKFANESTSASSGPIGVPRSFDLNQAVRAAAAYDAFATSASSADGQPLHLSGNNPPSVLTASHQGSPRNKDNSAGLPGISGPGLYGQTEENYHPKYGYLPRRVRKTSFDHTVEKGSSGSSPGFIPPPMTAKQARKRPAEASPQILAKAPVPVPEDDVGANFLDFPTADSTNLPPGEFPSTAFTFSFPHSYDTFFDMAAATTNTPANTNDMLDFGAQLSASSPGDMVNFANAFGDGGLSSMTSFAALHQAPVETLAPGLLQGGGIDGGAQSFDGGDLHQGDPSVTFQQMMQQYLNTNATVNPFTHVNPAQVLGNMGQTSERAISVSVTESPHAESSPHGPTKQMPRSVGGKSVPNKDDARAPGPVRSNSSPHLAGLGVHSMTASDPSSNQMKKGGPSNVTKSGKGGSKTGPNTPSSDNDHGAGSVITGGESPIMCTNCQTTNTPLWRRDPDGQPLCNVSDFRWALEWRTSC